jgi:hypothetical protein
MIMNGPVNLVLNNAGLITDGAFKQGTSTIIYTGNAITSPSLLGGSNTTAFKHVTINRPSNDVLLNGDIVIDGTLTMISGNLQLNNHTLNLTGIITGESNQSHITGVTGGVVKISAKLNAPQAVNPGNIGVAITSAANLGATVITRGHVQQTLLNGAQGIQRYFDITPANNAGLNATLRVYYLETELADADESILSLWSRAASGTTWRDIGKDNSDVTNNWVFKSGIDNFTRFTLGSQTASGGLLRVTTNTSSTNSLDKTAIAAQVYPNPLHEQFIVSLSGNQEKEYVISLYNQYGQLLQCKKSLCRKGMNQISWNMNNYANGVYYLVFENKELENIKIIKQ